jgi:hypothetical protein
VGDIGSRLTVQGCPGKNINNQKVTKKAKKGWKYGSSVITYQTQVQTLVLPKERHIMHGIYF